MKRTDKVLVYGILAVAAAGGLCVACLVAVVFLPFSWFAHGGAADAARLFLRSDPVVKAKLGDIESFGYFPNGSVRRVNGAGTAHLVFSIKGAKADGRATVDLSKKPGEDWKVRAATLFVDGRDYVLKGSGAGARPAPVSPQEPGPEVGYPKDKDQGLAA